MTRLEDWPPDYIAAQAWRLQQLARFEQDPDFLESAKTYYREGRAVEFINHWCTTYDPRLTSRGRSPWMPFVLFPKQIEFVEFLQSMIQHEANGLIEKSRDMGATWLAAAFSVWLWLFWPGSAIGWGSRKQELVDKLGDPDSIFEKIRMLIRGLHEVFQPTGFDQERDMSYMRVVNPENASTITGEVGDNIGRGGRKLIYFKDESAHYPRPEKVEAALMDNTRVQIDMSSVNGLGNVFHRKRMAGVIWTPGKDPELERSNILVMDWRDHPEKDRAWYNRRKAKATNDGLEHVFAQEVDRNYSAAIANTIIPLEWIESAINADKNLGFNPGSIRSGALDVADSEAATADRNAYAGRVGVLLDELDEWGGARDVAVSARRAIEMARPHCRKGRRFMLQYDSIGVGAGVKVEANRLADEKLLPPGLRFISWEAGSGPLDPDKHVVENDLGEDDEDSPLNSDFYANLKAQGWWLLRRRFERTHRAITEGVKFDPALLISISPDLPMLPELMRELSQPTASRSTAKLKLVVNKQPDGTRSPNKGDAVMMLYHPALPADAYTLDFI